MNGGRMDRQVAAQSMVKRWAVSGLLQEEPGDPQTPFKYFGGIVTASTIGRGGVANLTSFVGMHERLVLRPRGPSFRHCNDRGEALPHQL